MGLYVGPWSRMPRTLDFHKYKHFCGALVPSTPRTRKIHNHKPQGTPGSSQIQASMRGPGAQYAKDPWKCTNISVDVGPGSPIHQGPREVNKYRHLCEARVPSMPRTPGGSQIYHCIWGPGAQCGKGLGRLTNISLCVGPGSLIRQGPREVHKYNPLCGVLVPSTPRTPGGSQI